MSDVGIPSTKSMPERDVIPSRVVMCDVRRALSLNTVALTRLYTVLSGELRPPDGGVTTRGANGDVTRHPICSPPDTGLGSEVCEPAG